MVKRVIVIIDRVDNPRIESEVFGAGYDLHCLNGNLGPENDDLLASADGILVWHNDLASEILDKFKNCKGIVRYGTGFDNIDLKYSRSLGIPVCNTPDYGVDEVADTACAMILNSVRQIKYYEKLLTAGKGTWGDSSDLKLLRTSDHALGIVGCGRIGTAVALRMKAFGLNIGFYDPYLARGYEKAIGIKRFESMDQLISESTIISFHTPLTNETAGIVNKDFINRLNDNTILINTARGPIISDLQAVIDGLNSKKILFLGIDVVPDESGDLSHNFFASWKDSDLSARILVTPHSAYYSDSAFPEMRLKAALNLKGILEGANPVNLVNG
jgi:lactate dehydrogenase-like 2-hydroxyacid dehydrogenase